MASSSPAGKRPSKQKTKYSPEFWAELQPALRSLSVVTLEMAEAVLVDGRRVAEVAEENGCNRQTVYAAIKRVRGRLSHLDDGELVPVTAWVPRASVEPVRAYVEEQGGTVDSGS